VGYKAAYLLAVVSLVFLLPAAEGQEKVEAQKPRPPEVQVVKAQGSTVLVISGVGPVDKNGKLVAPDDFAGQFHQTWANVRRLAAGAGSPLGNIVSLTVYLKDDKFQEQFTELQRETFGAWSPATTFAAAKNLRTKGALLEIHAVAINVERRTQRGN
jgi:enamine deaminase RidA (YjgF/YER057c/UK114 family)